MKTIFVICAAGQEIRNFLYSDFYKFAKARADLRFVVFVPSERIDRIARNFLIRAVLSSRLSALIFLGG